MTTLRLISKQNIQLLDVSEQTEFQYQGNTYMVDCSKAEEIRKKVSKPVTQYTRQGKKLKTFPSMAAAERSTAVYATSIGNQAGGNCKTAGGSIWRWRK